MTELTYDYVPQKIYMIEGIPAKTYGEWPGITSNHWKGSIKIIRQNQPEQIFDQNAKAPLLGRRHFSERPKTCAPAYEGKRMFPGRKDLENIEEKKTGLKYIGEPKRIEKPDLNRRHFPPRSGKERIPAPFYIRTFKPDGNTCTIEEMLLEKEFGMKKRVKTLQEQRNYLPIRIPGDKHYKFAEQITGYFKDGGLVPGSSNRINFNKTQSLKNKSALDTIDLKVHTLDKNKIWKNKVKAERIQNDETYVNNLNMWENNILSLYSDPNQKKEEKQDTNANKQQKPEPKKAPPKGKKK